MHHYGRRRRQGKTKGLEQAGDWKRLLEHMALLSEAHGDNEEAAKLRAQLRPEPLTNRLETEPAYTQPEKPRLRKGKQPAPSSPELRQRKAWEEVRARHER
jgi:hypothetical protein